MGMQCSGKALASDVKQGTREIGYPLRWLLSEDPSVQCPAPPLWHVFNIFLLIPVLPQPHFLRNCQYLIHSVIFNQLVPPNIKCCSLLNTGCNIKSINFD